MIAPSDIFDDFGTDLVNIYGLCEEIDFAQSLASNWYSEKMSGGASENSMYFGKGTPSELDASYQYKRKFVDLYKNVQKDGPNAQSLRKMAIVNANALWEHKYRNSIGGCLNPPITNLPSKIFVDLNKYRQAVLHVQGRLDKEIEVLKFCKKGEVLSLSKEQFHELFKMLVSELNSISKTYFFTNSQYSLDIYLNQI